MALSLLSKLIIIELFCLFVQFGFGMISNLFADIPLGAPFNFLVYADGLAVLAHIVNGSIILFLGSAIMWFSYKAKNPLTLKLSAFAVVFTISAIANGILFLVIFLIPALYNVDNYFSLAMALSFIAVFTILFSELYVIKKTDKS